jgi:hypothetical protein
MRRATIFASVVTLAASAVTEVRAQDRDDSLKIYAINVIHDRLWKKPFVGYGVYLGKGVVATAAHVLGRFPAFIANPRVLVGGREIAARVVKQGSFTTTDLAILTVDERQLPVSYRLRRNPLCKDAPNGGDGVIIALPQMIARSRIVISKSLPIEYRATSNTFIDDAPIPGGSGAGVFHAESKCLLGILSSKISNHNFRVENGRSVRDLSRSTIDIARHFVPASAIDEFMPADSRF